MRVTSGYDLISLFLGDSYYPTSSPTPAPRMIACAAAEGTQLRRCKALDYTFDAQGKTFCRAPDDWVCECVNALPNKGVGHVPQRSEPAHFPIPRGVSESNRRTRRLDTTKHWVGQRLESLSQSGSYVLAASVMLGHDFTISMQEYDDLAHRLWSDFVQKGVDRTHVR